MPAVDDILHARHVRDHRRQSGRHGLQGSQAEAVLHRGMDIHACSAQGGQRIAGSAGDPDAPAAVFLQGLGNGAPADAAYQHHLNIRVAQLFHRIQKVVIPLADRDLANLDDPEYAVLPRFPRLRSRRKPGGIDAQG
ncbi:hypothetical protein D3C81_1896240 [compost metagenome]